MRRVHAHASTSVRRNEKRVCENQPTGDDGRRGRFKNQRLPRTISFVEAENEQAREFYQTGVWKEEEDENGGGDATNNNMNELAPLRSLVSKVLRAESS